MKVGDLALFYHSNAEPPGIAGIARVRGPARADYTAWDPVEAKHFELIRKMGQKPSRSVP